MAKKSMRAKLGKSNRLNPRGNNRFFNKPTKKKKDSNRMKLSHYHDHDVPNHSPKKESFFSKLMHRFR